MKPEAINALAKLFIQTRHKLENDGAIAALEFLVVRHGASYRTNCGADHLALWGVRASCTWGATGLVNGWLRAAERHLIKAYGA